MNDRLKSSVCLLCGIILLLLAGCDSRFVPKDHLDQYLADLKRSKYIELSDITSPSWTGYPALRNRLQPLSEFDIGLLDFLSLQRCELGYLAGKRNSVLGRVMTHSQRFLYEVNIIRAIESCQIGSDDLAPRALTYCSIKASRITKSAGECTI